MEERERPLTVADATAVGLQERCGRLASGVDVAAGARPHERGEPSGLAVTDVLEQRLGTRGIGQLQAGGGRGDGEPGVAAGALGGRDHRFRGGLVEQQLEPVLGQQRGRPLRVAGRQGVGDGLAAVTRAGQPLGRARVKLGLEARALEPQARPQQLGEQAVVAEPGALAVECGDEHPVALELLEHERAARPAGEGVGEVAADAPDDARAQKQLARLGWLDGEHLAGQVVRHRAVVAGELGDEGVAVGLRQQRQTGQPQAGGPALSPLEQARDLLRGQLDAELGQQADRLLGGEREVRLAQLAQAPREP
jgi:hypothetical protein